MTEAFWSKSAELELKGYLAHRTRLSSYESILEIENTAERHQVHSWHHIDLRLPQRLRFLLLGYKILRDLNGKLQVTQKDSFGEVP